MLAVRHDPIPLFEADRARMEHAALQTRSQP